MPPRADVAALQRTLSLAIEAAVEKDQLTAANTADLKAVTAELATATELTNALMLERDAALERAKLAEDRLILHADRVQKLEMQLATKDFELDAANRRADLAEEEYHAALGVLNRLRRFHGYPNTPLNRARRFDAEDEGGDNAHAGVSVHVCERPPPPPGL